MLGNHGSIVIPQNTKYAEEMRRWESQHTVYGPPGRPFHYAEYPMQMYRAKYEPGKGIVLTDSVRVETADEARNMRSRGFHQGPQAAHDAAEAEQREFGRLAAEREFQIQHNRLSERAVAEVRAAEADHGGGHMPDVPITPVRRRGRPAKVKEA